MKSKFFLSFIVFFYQTFLTSAQTSENASDYIALTFNNEVQGKVGEKNTYTYYKLDLTKDDIAKGSIIQLTVSPLGKFTRFSDPDIYIGREGKKKPTRASNDWFSEQFGMDIVLIDPNLEKKVDANLFKSKGRNCPFDGWDLKGWPVKTICGGNIVSG